MSFSPLRVGGVPEHFNYPWHLVQETDLHQKLDFSFTWQDFPGGTGAMSEALEQNELDLAIMLTEGSVAGIQTGKTFQILGTYVNSALNWGIHVAAPSPWASIQALEGKRFAISRYHSGSHLMSFVLAKQNAWAPQDLSFELVGNMEGARKALKEGQADAFMWEKFTTKPLVDSGEWRRIGECLTPWPCFVLVARKEIIEERANEILPLLEVVKEALSYHDKSSKIRYIADKYALRLEDVATWFAFTEWQVSPHLSRAAIEKVLTYLTELGVIESASDPELLKACICAWE